MNWADWLSFPGSIAVYGAGYVAETLWIALERCGLSDRVRCFVVTERKDGQSFKHGKQILSLQEYILSRPPEERIVIAAHHSIASEMEQKLKDLDLREHLLPPFYPGMAFTEAASQTVLPLRRILKMQEKKNNWITVRYAALKALKAGEQAEHSTGLQIYLKTQCLHAGRATVEARIRAMDQLLHSMQEKGFLQNCPVQMDTSFRIIDGLHRIACAALLDIPKIPCRLFEPNEIYDIFFPLDNCLPAAALAKAGLSLKEQQFLAEQKKELLLKPLEKELDDEE